MELEKRFLKKLKILLKYKYILIFLLVLLFSIFRINIFKKSNYNLDNKDFIGIVTSYEYKDNYITFILKGKEKIKCNYYGELNIDLNYGDIISLKGDLSIPYNNTIPNTFNYKKYLFNNDIFYILNVDKVISIKRTNNFLYKIKNTIVKKINKIDKKGYLNTFILGNKNYLESNVYETYKANGIIHIFSISGMHISLLASIILFILNKFKKSKYNVFIVIVFLIFYLIITNYQASIVRSIVFYILLNIFKTINYKIDIKDVLILSISLILLVYPKYIYNLGFIYSSLISFTLIYYSKYFKYKYLINILLISFISFFVSLPITVNNNYEINLLSIFINIIFVPLISFIVYPLSLLTFIFPFLINLFNFIINIIESISSLLYKFDFLIINIPKMNFLAIAIYYLLFYTFLSLNKKYIVLFIVYIFMLKYVNLMDSHCYVYFLDVGQGDMITIKYKDECIVIDTGGKKYGSNYEIMDSIITFFKSIGINNVDNLIITHGDSDHIGNANYLINNFDVKRIKINNGEINELEKALPKDKIISKVTTKLNFQILDHTLKSEENDNSIISYLNIFNTKFIFMGDAPKEVENEIINKYKIQVDVIKIGHHGSKTSSDYNFLKTIKPKYAIISSGRNNIYNHPHKETLDTLNSLNIKYFNTQDFGTILIKISKKNRTFLTYRP